MNRTPTQGEAHIHTSLALVPLHTQTAFLASTTTLKKALALPPVVLLTGRLKWMSSISDSVLIFLHLVAWK